MKSKFSSNQRGMTLIEVLAVIVLIALIMSVVAKGVIGKSDSAKAELNVVKMQNLMQSLETYRLKYNRYPATLDGLVSPSGDMKSSGKVFTKLASKDDLNDVWGYPFAYKIERDGRAFSLSTLGSDGIEGGEGGKQDVTLQP